MIDFDWHRAFMETSKESTKTTNPVSNLSELKDFLDKIHIRECLLRPYSEMEDYPYVMPDELIPSFENELWEYKGLPGFSMVAFDRPLASFSEPFQYDILSVDDHESDNNPNDFDDTERNVSNIQVILQRLPRCFRGQFTDEFTRSDDVTSLASYPSMLPFLFNMDRAHVIARNKAGNFVLSGIFASFPSDFDGELKRFGVQIGKFRVDDSKMYEKNRMFVNQYLMELYGFPIASERRTSSAVFARRLFRNGERFLIRVLGQSDRTISTIWNDGTARHFPFVEKMALVQIPPERKDVVAYVEKRNAFVDKEKRIVILHLYYRQHAYHATNLRQDRALSLEKQIIVNPLNGDEYEGIGILKVRSALLLTLNDIVRGEYSGRIVYKHNELIENTDTPEKRIKAVYAWLTKNSRYIISSIANFSNDVIVILDDYLKLLENSDLPASLIPIYQELKDIYTRIVQARQIHSISSLMDKDDSKSHNAIAALQRAIAVMTEISEKNLNFTDEMQVQLYAAIERVLKDSYIRRRYLSADPSKLSTYGMRVRSMHESATKMYQELRERRKMSQIS